MRICGQLTCQCFPCEDVHHECFVVPGVDIDPARVLAAMISEAAPSKLEDYYYAEGDPLFARTTAFRDAGAALASIGDVLELGVYLTTAVKCGKTGYGIKNSTVDECSHILERELALFPNVRAYLLMGDVAIRALNTISRREGQGRVVPAGSTYKIRGQEFWFRGRRVFPSYLQAGPSFFIEKSKRRMIAEDIARALEIAGRAP
jgi:uracil-DNA glycosylase